MKSKQSFKAEMDHQNRLCCDRKRCHQKYVGCPELTKYSAPMMTAATATFQAWSSEELDRWDIIRGFFG